MISVTEFAPATECVTATVHMTALPGYEAYQGPLSIGYYLKNDEVFLESEGTRINIPAHLIATFLKQIKRAQTIAKEQAK